MKAKRKINLKQALKRMEKVGKEFSNFSVSKDPKIAELERKLLNIATRAKKEGITSA